MPAAMITSDQRCGVKSQQMFFGLVIWEQAFAAILSCGGILEVKVVNAGEKLPDQCRFAKVAKKQQTMPRGSKPG